MLKYLTSNQTYGYIRRHESSYIQIFITTLKLEHIRFYSRSSPSALHQINDAKRTTSRAEKSARIRKKIRMKILSRHCISA